LIRWTFFFEEGAIATELNEDEEGTLRDRGLIRDIENEENWLTIPHPEIDTRVNLNRVKAITRQIVEVASTAPIPPQDQEKELL
jgi:hypothetical protein